MLKIENIYKSFRPTRSLGQELAGFWKKKTSQGIQAIRGLDLKVKNGEILGLVGESGSGKSTLGRLMCGLYQPDQGQVIFGDKELSSFSPQEKHKFHREVQIMFQDPASSLNPRLTAGDTLAEALIIHKLGNRTYRRDKVNKLLGEVGLDPTLVTRYPHQFSGGQRQRLCLARALSLDPELLIADEPASALDVSIQAQIINLLLDLKASRGLTMVLISHDLALVRLMADRIVVMYGGLIMEIIPRDLLGKINHHPYVKALWASAEALNHRETGLILEGEPPDPQNPPPGCPFAPRCPEASTDCHNNRPLFKPMEAEHFCACLKR